MPNRLPPLTDAEVENLRKNHVMTSDSIRATYALAESRVETVVREAQRKAAVEAWIAATIAERSRVGFDDPADARDRYLAKYAPTPPTCDRCKGPMRDGAKFATHDDMETCIAFLAARVAALEGR